MHLPNITLFAEQDFHLLEYLFIELPGVVIEVIGTNSLYVPVVVALIAAILWRFSKQKGP